MVPSDIFGSAEKTAGARFGNRQTIGHLANGFAQNVDINTKKWLVSASRTASPRLLRSLAASNLPYRLASPIYR